MVEQAPVPDWKGMFPNINEKYSELLQSHHSLCGEIEQKSAYIQELTDALEETRKERDTALLQNGVMKKALARIVAMDAVTDDERAHYWSDRAERMRDSAMIALGGEKVAPLSELLETARRALSYIQRGATDLDDAKRAAEHALKHMPYPGNDFIGKRVDLTDTHPIKGIPPRIGGQPLAKDESKCPVCSGPMTYRNETFRFHAYDCLDEKCPGTLKCDLDCCRIMRPELALDLIVAECGISTVDWKYERVKNILRLVHQHGVESALASGPG